VASPNPSEGGEKEGLNYNLGINKLKIKFKNRMFGTKIPSFGGVWGGLWKLR